MFLRTQPQASRPLPRTESSSKEDVIRLRKSEARERRLARKSALKRAVNSSTRVMRDPKTRVSEERKAARKSPFKRSLVDFIDRDLTIPVKLPERKNMARNGSYELQRQPKHLYGRVATKPLVGLNGQISVTYSGNFKSSLNKLRRWFGSISRERTFNFVLKCMVFLGYTKRDFRNLMRIRDLSIRGRDREYKSAVQKLANSLPSVAKVRIGGTPKRGKRGESLFYNGRNNAKTTYPAKGRSYRR